MLPIVRKKLIDALHPISLEIEDDSAEHMGHHGAGANDHAHYRIAIVSELFTGKSPVTRHRMVYSALGELMNSHIHAVQIQAKAPNES